ncbi:MAG: hypothetical protein NVSMB23_29170 [Myxococcales bacterium]
MFGMSVVEIGIILVLALVLLGPDELPKVAKTVGKALRELRKTTDDLKSTFEQEMVRLDDEPKGTPMLVSPPAEPEPTPSTGALDQLRDPGTARAAARTLAQPADPGAARAAARLAAAGIAPAGLAQAESAPAVPVAESAPAGPPSAAAADPALESKAAESPAGAAPVAGPDLAEGTVASLDPSESQPAGGADPASHAPPSPRAPPPATVPREKKSGPTA